MSTSETRDIAESDVPTHGDTVHPRYPTRHENDIAVGRVPRGASGKLSVRPFGGHAELRWPWPESCVLMRVVWRADISPVSADDPQAHCRDVPRSDYVGDGCLRIPSPGPGRWHFRLYPWAETPAGRNADATDILSAVARFVRPRIGYSFRRGRFRRNALTVTLESSEILTTPTIVIVAALGTIQPLRAEDGVVIGQIDVVTLTSRVTRSFSFEVTHTHRPLRFAAFFSDLGMYDEVELHSLTSAEIWLR